MVANIMQSLPFIVFLFGLFFVLIKGEHENRLLREPSSHSLPLWRKNALKYSNNVHEATSEKSKGSIMYKDRIVRSAEEMETTTETEIPTTQGNIDTTSSILDGEVIMEAPSDKEYHEFVRESVKDCDKFLFRSSKLRSDAEMDKMLQRCLLIHAAHARIKPQLEKEQHGDIYLPDDYNKLEVPKINETEIKTYGEQKNATHYKLNPVKAAVLLVIRGIRGIDDAEEEMVLDLDVWVEWVDGQILKKSENEKKKGLELPGDVFLNPVFMEKIWTPDIYFEEAHTIESPTFMGKPETVVLFPWTGTILYKTRLIVKLNCEMNFFHYPADLQNCTFSLRSFSYKTKDVIMSWIVISGNQGVYLLETSDPNFDYQVANFTAEDLPLKLGDNNNDTPSIIHSTLKFTIKSRRKLSYHLVQTYLPSSFFVFITWLCFMIPPEMFEFRVGISMTTLLTLTAMFASVREHAPTVSYVKAIDIWMAGCIIFLFAALTAFTASQKVSQGLKKLQRETAEDDGSEKDSVQRPNNKKRKPWDRDRSHSVLYVYKISEFIVEKYISWILSVGFILFIIVYWTWLLIESEYYNWEVNKSFNHV